MLSNWRIFFIVVAILFKMSINFMNPDAKIYFGDSFRPEINITRLRIDENEYTWEMFIMEFFLQLFGLVDGALIGIAEYIKGNKTTYNAIKDK